MSLKNPRDRVRSSRDNLDVRDVLGGFPNRRRPQGGQKRRRFMGPVIIVCAILAVLVAVDYWMNYGRIFSGVEVGGVSLGGMTSEEARAALDERASVSLQQISFTGGPEEGRALSAEGMGVDFDSRATVDDAYAAGRRGDVLERIGERLEAAWGTVVVPATVDYDREAVRTGVENLAARTNEDPSDAYVAINGSEASAVESREGYEVDVETTMANTDEALQNLNGEVEISAGALTPAVLTPAAEEASQTARAAMSNDPATLRAEGEEWELTPAEIGRSLGFTPTSGGELEVSLDREQFREVVSDVYDDIEADPVEAGFEFDGGGVAVTEGRAGKSIEEEEFSRDVEAGLLAGTRQFNVPVVTQEPALTTEQAEELKPTEIIGSYRTDYTLSSDKTPERVDNLDIASKAISGQVLAPGEVFSVNEVVAPLDYNETKVIIDGAEEKAAGGGLCQVSSTLYMAANYAGLDIVERAPHDAQLPYIRPGMDATVWFGSLDMKFQNTSDGYILVREYVADDGYIYAEIWGQPTGLTVEMDSEPEYLGADYSKWVTYQKVTDEDGEVVYDGELHTDTYMPLIDEKGKTIAPNDPYLNIAPVNY